MLPDALPQLINTLLRLPHLDAAQLRELIQDLPDPQGSAQEMVRRGWITQSQFSSLFPDTRQETPRETILIGCGDDDLPPDVSGDDWDLSVGDQEDQANGSTEVEWTRADRTEDAVPCKPEAEPASVLCGAPSTTPFEWDAAALSGGIAACRRESDTDKHLRQWMAWASKGLLMWVLFVGSFFVTRQFFGKNPAAPRVAQAARQEPRGAKKTSQYAIAKRRVSNRPIAAAKVDAVPNHQAAAAQPADLRPQPAAPEQVAAADPPIIFPAQAAPQPSPGPTVWNGPYMFPATPPPATYLPVDPAAFQRMARRNQERAQRQMMQQHRRQMQRHQPNMRQHHTRIRG